MIAFLNKIFGLGSQEITVRPVERSLFVPTSGLSDDDRLAELDAIIEARQIMAGVPLHNYARMHDAQEE